MTEAISPQALSQLIGSIYDCALEPDRWDRTLASYGTHSAHRRQASH